jgi:thermitase
VQNDGQRRRALAPVPSPRGNWQRAIRLAWRALAALSVVTLVLGLSPQASWGGAPGAQPPPYAPGQLLVKFKPGVSAEILGQAMPGISAQAIAAPELAKLGVNVLKVPDSQLTATLAALRQNPLVEYAEPDYLVQAADVIPNDPDWIDQWGPADIQAPQAWAITTGTISVTIAVIDTGVDLMHPDLASQIDLVNSKSFLSYAPTAQDDYGHGTHVAGIAAAIGNNGVGIAGMAWGVRIMALKVLDYNGSGYESDVASAINYAADHGAQVINLSLGGSTSDTTLSDAVNYAYGKGVTIVAAAGNGNTSQPFYPAAYPHVIAVASVDSNNQRSYFSNFGSDIALAAPGRSIYSTMWPGNNLIADPGCPGTSYCYLSGTSMATPHVAGVAALLAGMSPFNTPDKILAAMENTALDLGSPGWDQYYGYGLVQAGSALQYRILQISPATAFTFTPAGSAITYSLTVTNAAIISDSFTVTVSAGAPFTNTVSPALISALAPNASAPVTVTVTSPPGAARGSEDIAQVTVTSMVSPTLQASATLTTAVPYILRLLLVFR